MQAGDKRIVENTKIGVNIATRHKIGEDSNGTHVGADFARDLHSYIACVTDGLKEGYAVAKVWMLFEVV